MSSHDNMPASPHAARRGPRLAAWTWAAFAIGGVAPDAMAGPLVQGASSVWGPATALSLTLVTAIIRSQK